MHDVIKAFGVQTDFSIQELPRGKTLESGCEETLSECKYCPGLQDCKFAKNYIIDTTLRDMQKLAYILEERERREQLKSVGVSDNIADLLDDAKRVINESNEELSNLFILSPAEKCIEDNKDMLGLNDVPVPKQTTGLKILKVAKETLVGLAAAALITYSTFFPQHLELAGYKVGRDLDVDVYVQKDVPYPIRLIQS